jgi:Protein of unknown function (DUF3667)
VDTCVNCGAELTGAFCANCGFVDSDRRLGHLLRHFISSATDLDGRVWRTLRALLFHPGLLSREYFEGRRARWLSPVSLFFAASVLYFVAPLHGSDFTPQFNQQVRGPIRQLARSPGEKPLTPEEAASPGAFHSRFTSSWIDNRVKERDAKMRAATNGAAGYSYHDYRLAYDAKSDDVSKVLIMLHLPFAAMVLTLLFYRQRRYFAEQVVFLMHYVAFDILILQAIVQVDTLVRLAGASIPDPVLDWTMRIILIVYAVVALHRAYALRWFAAMGAAAVMLSALVFVNIYVYRAIQFIVTFALT